MVPTETLKRECEKNITAQDLRNLHNEPPHDLYRSQNIIGIIYPMNELAQETARIGLVRLQGFDGKIR
jgi:hypothetical protein